MKNETACSFFIWRGGGGGGGGGEVRLNLIFTVLQNWKSEKWIMKNESLSSVFIFFRKLTNDKLKFVFNFHFFQWKQTWKFNFYLQFSPPEKDILHSAGSLWRNQQDGSPETEYMRRPDEPQLIMAKQLSTATTPFCFGFYQCCVDVLQSKIWRSTISIAEFSICKCTSLWLTRGCAAGQRKVFVHRPFLKQGIYD